MVQKKTDNNQDDESAAQLRARVLILEARYYDKIADLLADGAVQTLERRGVTFERIEVPGALELPLALAAVTDASVPGRKKYDGVIVLGCVIRGETAHYDIVCNNANHWLMYVAIRAQMPLGNAILTVENEAQALARAEGGSAGKGGDAARAVLTLIELRRSHQSG